MKLKIDDKKDLIDLARKTIERYLSDGTKYDPSPELKKRFSKEMGSFTTLKKRGQLRGCIGYIVPRYPLWESVRNVSIEAAVNDPRFPSVKPDELDDITVEISVLTVPKEVKDPKEIEMGVHGVIVKQGFRQGVFLPQVADETGWDRETFLDYLCMHKACLPRGAWKDTATELLSFRAIVFSEEGLK